MLFVLIALFSFLLQFFLPWWIIVPVAFGLAAWKAQSSGHAFKSAFWSLFLIWVIMSLFKSIPNENLLANRIGLLFMLPAWKFDWIIVALLTGLIGGLTAGFAALAGFLARKAVVKDDKPV